MALYFAKYCTAANEEYRHQASTEWITSYLMCDDCGRDYAKTATHALTAANTTPG